MNARPRLLFISSRYLLPPDSGGRIRTGHVLKSLKGGRFHVTLLSPAPATIPEDHSRDIALMCDEFLSWPEPRRGKLFAYSRMRYLALPLPISVVSDNSSVARRAVVTGLSRGPDIVVVDFLHAAVLLPRTVEVCKVLFTHNVETEIFSRHETTSDNLFLRTVWRDQRKKMERFECETLRRFDSVVAVSNRDHDHFLNKYDVHSSVIPTGVDLDYFAFHPPAALRSGPPPVIAFTGSMDYLPNIDGVKWFMDSVWPLILRNCPSARARIIGRNPPSELVREARQRSLQWEFTGYVDDVRPYLEEATIYAIPLRIGGGTRIKVYEAMAFGRPIVSTSVGVEGLDVEAGKHYLRADTDVMFAKSVIELLQDESKRLRVATKARSLVERNFSFRAAGDAFERICIAALDKRSSAL